MKKFEIFTPEQADLGGRKRGLDEVDDMGTIGLRMPKTARIGEPTMPDLIAGLIRRRYLQLCTEMSVSPTCFVAGFALTIKEPVTGVPRDAYVVSLATGAKALEFAVAAGKTGLVLLDSHAEVLARRGLLLYLYQVGVRR